MNLVKGPVEADMYTKNNLKEDIEAVILCILTIGAVALLAGYPLWQMAMEKI